MKIINLVTFEKQVSGAKVYEFLHKNYQYADAIEVTMDMVIEDLVNRGTISEPPEIFKFFGDIFNNDYYKNHVENVSSPAMIFEMYEYILSKCKSQNAGIPCVAESGSFLDICYHYSIPVFITNWSNVLDTLLKYEHDWTIIDGKLFEKISDEYWMIEYNLDNDFLSTADTSEFFAKERQKYNRIVGQTDTLYTEDSITYLYEELIG